MVPQESYMREFDQGSTRRSLCSHLMSIQWGRGWQTCTDLTGKSELVIEHRKHQANYFEPKYREDKTQSGNGYVNLLSAFECAYCVN